MISSVFVLAALLSSTLARVVPTTPHQKRDAPPDGFKAVSAAPDDEAITLRFALNQPDFAGLEKALYDVSSPKSGKYGQYLSKSEVDSYISPSQETLSTLSSWLSSNGLTASSLSSAGDWISIQTTVAQANKLLQADYTSYEHQGLEKAVTRTLSYSLPAELKNHVTAVHPTVSFPPPLPNASLRQWNITDSSIASSGKITRREDSDLPESCQRIPDDDSNASFVRPYSVDCRFDLYGISKTPATLPKDKNNLWLSGFDNQFANKMNLKGYLEEWRPELANSTTFDLVSVDGGINNQLPIGGGLLTDPEMWVAGSTATGVPLTFMSVGTDTSDDLLVWSLDQANYVLGMDNPPKVLLHDYSIQESTFDPVLASRLCNAYAQLSARGVSLIHSVPIGGVEIGWPSGTCTKFEAPFPASCPYVISVGGTEVSNGVTELPPGGFGANAGGFSNYFSRPQYQDASVSGYLDKLEDGIYDGMYNASGRGIPDISLVSVISPRVDSGYGIGAPAFAGSILGSMIALLNDELISAGKPALGFLNPWIYENIDIFHDIVSGSNPGCGTDGFNATTGWDPVTGVGSPIYAKMRAAAGL